MSTFHWESQDRYHTFCLELISDLWRTARSRTVKTTTETKRTPYTFYPDSLVVDVLPCLCSLWTDSVSGPRAPRALCLLPFGMVLSLQPRVASPHPRAEQYSALGTRSADFWGSVSPEITPVLCPVLGMRALLVAMNLRSGSLVGAAWVPPA